MQDAYDMSNIGTFRLMSALSARPVARPFQAVFWNLHQQACVEANPAAPSNGTTTTPALLELLELQPLFRPGRTLR
jgi:hypothetical protein